MQPMISAVDRGQRPLGFLTNWNGPCTAII
jgi:hypothetical protein